MATGRAAGPPVRAQATGVGLAARRGRVLWQARRAAQLWQAVGVAWRADKMTHVCLA